MILAVRSCWTGEHDEQHSNWNMLCRPKGFHHQVILPHHPHPRLLSASHLFLQDSHIDTLQHLVLYKILDGFEHLSQGPVSGGADWGVLLTGRELVVTGPALPVVCRRVHRFGSQPQCTSQQQTSDSVGSMHSVVGGMRVDLVVFKYVRPAALRGGRWLRSTRSAHFTSVAVALGGQTLSSPGLALPERSTC